MAPRTARTIDLAVGPNPTYGRVTANFSLQRDARLVDLAIFDATGRRVKTLVNGPLTAGTQSVVWRGDDDAGQPTRAGIFFLRLQADGRPAVARKVLMIR